MGNLFSNQSYFKFKRKVYDYIDQTYGYNLDFVNLGDIVVVDFYENWVARYTKDSDRFLGRIEVKPEELEGIDFNDSTVVKKYSKELLCKLNNPSIKI